MRQRQRLWPSINYPMKFHTSLGLLCSGAAVHTHTHTHCTSEIVLSPRIVSFTLYGIQRFRCSVVMQMHTAYYTFVDVDILHTIVTCDEQRLWPGSFDILILFLFVCVAWLCISSNDRHDTYTYIPFAISPFLLINKNAIRRNRRQSAVTNRKINAFIILGQWTRTAHAHKYQHTHNRMRFTLSANPWMTAAHKFSARHLLFRSHYPPTPDITAAAKSSYGGHKNDDDNVECKDGDSKEYIFYLSQELIHILYTKRMRTCWLWNASGEKEWESKTENTSEQNDQRLV